MSNRADPSLGSTSVFLLCHRSDKSFSQESSRVNTETIPTSGRPRSTLRIIRDIRDIRVIRGKIVRRVGREEAQKAQKSESEGVTETIGAPLRPLKTES